MTEEWREIPGWEGFYAVSSAGRVKALSRTIPGRPGVLMHRKERELTQRVTDDGYRIVALSRSNQKKEIRVHRLVLLAFVGPCPDGMEGCHGDGDKANNSVDNLRWDTRSANTIDKVRHGAHPFASKTHCKRGHAFTEANTYIPPGRYQRVCITCRTANKRAYRASQRSAA